MILMQDPLLNGFNKTRKGTRKKKREMKESKMNFVDTAAEKGVRFETKQNLDFK